MITKRNKIEIATLHKEQIAAVDNLFDICDAEFNSCANVHKSFEHARSANNWSRYYLLHEVRRVADREEMFCSYHMAFVVSSRLAEIWFEQREIA